MLDEVCERERNLMAQITELQQLKASRPFPSSAGDRDALPLVSNAPSSLLLFVLRAEA